MHRRRAEKFRDIPWMALESQSEAKKPSATWVQETGGWEG